MWIFIGLNRFLRKDSFEICICQSHYFLIVRDAQESLVWRLRAMLSYRLGGDSQLDSVYKYSVSYLDQSRKSFHNKGVVWAHVAAISLHLSLSPSLLLSSVLCSRKTHNTNYGSLCVVAVKLDLLLFVFTFHWLELCFEFWD